MPRMLKPKGLRRIVGPLDWTGRYCGWLVQASPGLAAAEHATKGATLDAQGIGALHCDRRIVGAAAVRIEDPPAPFLILARPHIDQNLFAVEVAGSGGGGFAAAGGGGDAAWLVGAGAGTGVCGSAFASCGAGCLSDLSLSCSRARFDRRPVLS